jgi:hypothetical protein
VGPFVSERKLILSGIGGACVGLPPAARPAEAGAEPRAGVALAGVLEVAAPRRARRDSHRPKKGTAAQGDRHALPVLVQMVAVATGDRCCDDGRGGNRFRRPLAIRAGDLRGRSRFFFLGVTVAGGDCGSLMGRARLVQRDSANLRSGILHRGGPSRVAGPGKKGYGARTNNFKLQRFGARLSLHHDVA